MKTLAIINDLINNLIGKIKIRLGKPAVLILFAVFGAITHAFVFKITPIIISTNSNLIANIFAYIYTLVYWPIGLILFIQFCIEIFEYIKEKLKG